MKLSVFEAEQACTVPCILIGTHRTTGKHATQSKRVQASDLASDYVCASHAVSSIMCASCASVHTQLRVSFTYRHPERRM